MRPKPLHSRSDLISLIRDHAPTRACLRAIDEDRTECLGGFNPAEDFPYFLVRITSRFGKEWFIGIAVDEEAHSFHRFRAESVDWECWDGRASGRSLKDGDNPKTYALNRAKARRHADPKR